MTVLDSAVSFSHCDLSYLFYREQLVQPEKPASPKFIVTLDGVPSPPGYLSDQEEEEMSLMEGVRPVPPKASAIKGLRSLRAQQMHIISRQLESADGNPLVCSG